MKKIFSFIKSGIELKPVEIEMTFLPGAFQFQLIGLPDTAIKESEVRVKSALKNQGFQLPGSKQIVINLKPAHLKKSSRGLDLAIAAAYLWKSEQLPWPETKEDQIYLYGQLSLSGEVETPDDLDSLFYHPCKEPIITGPPNDLHFLKTQSISKLKDLNHPILQNPSLSTPGMKRPTKDLLSFPQPAAELLEIAATGEHSLLLAGPSGSGKTTLANALFQVLRDPHLSEFRQIRQISKLFGTTAHWRPMINPHHTIPPLSMVGGGSPPFPGEITRAHGGLLLLDELLEFHTQTKEALREPIEQGTITVSRGRYRQKFPARFHLVATTNLCPCGALVPGKKNNYCRYSLHRCRSYTEKLSGPLLDRFQMLSYSHEWSGKWDFVDLETISDRVQKAHEFQKSQGRNQTLNRDLCPQNLFKLMKGPQRDMASHLSGSRRRWQALMRVARSVADLDQQVEIRPEHLRIAEKYTRLNFSKLQRIFA